MSRYGHAAEARKRAFRALDETCPAVDKAGLEARVWFDLALGGYGLTEEQRAGLQGDFETAIKEFASAVKDRATEKLRAALIAAYEEVVGLEDELDTAKSGLREAQIRSEA